MNIESQKLVRKKCRLGRKYFDYTMVKEAFVCIYNDFLRAVQQNQECSWYGEMLQFLPKYFLEKGDYSEETGPLALGSSPGWESCPRILDSITRNYKHFVF